MIIDIARLPEEGATFTGEEPPAILGLEHEQGVSVEGPVQYRLAARMSSGQLLVEGAVWVTVRFTCSRCTRPFAVEVRDDAFWCMHTPGRTGEERLEEGGWTANEEDAGGGAALRGLPEGQLVDLTGDIRDTILLAFPAHPVCAAQCKGLCFRCGADLNRESCKCKGDPPDGRWSALDKLTL